MNNVDFNNLFISRTDDSMRRAVSKGSEYMIGTDRLHNFKAASRLIGDFDEYLREGQALVITPALSALFIASKQIVSLIDIVKKQASDSTYIVDDALLNEKSGDVHVYVPLIEACVVEENIRRKTMQAGTV